MKGLPCEILLGLTCTKTASLCSIVCGICCWLSDRPVWQRWCVALNSPRTVCVCGSLFVGGLGNKFSLVHHHNCCARELACPSWTPSFFEARRRAPAQFKCERIRHLPFHARVQVG